MPPHAHTYPDLLINNELYRVMVAQIRDTAIFFIDTEGYLRTWNAGVRDVFGYEEEEFKGRPAAMIFTPEDVSRGAPQNELLRAAHHGVASDVRWHLRKDGSRFYCDGFVTAIRDENGDLIGYSKVARDAGERIEAQQRATHLSAIFESSHDAIIGSTVEGKIISWNPAAERIFGYTADEILGRPLDLLIPLEETERVRELKERAGRGERVVDVDAVRVAKHERPVPVSLTLSAMRDLEGNLTGFAGVLRDRTERLRAAEKLEMQARELARSNEELESFAYTASHDLQEPIRTIVAFTQLIAAQNTGRLSRETDKHISFVLEAANRMSRLVSSLIDYSRISHTAHTPQPPVELDRVVDEVLRVMSFSIADSNAEIIREPLPAISADRDQMAQLFQNLIGNAIRYRKPNGTPHIEISAVFRQPREWVFRVADNGIGFPPQFAENIFGIFKRLHGPRYSGTGIGLATCRRIVERHGGRIWAESAGAGLGAQFFFTLPA